MPDVEAISFVSSVLPRSAEGRFRLHKSDSLTFGLPVDPVGNDHFLSFQSLSDEDAMALWYASGRLANPHTSWLCIISIRSHLLEWESVRNLNDRVVIEILREILERVEDHLGEKRPRFDVDIQCEDQLSNSLCRNIKISCRVLLLLSYLA